MAFTKFTGDREPDELDIPKYAYWAYGSNLSTRQMNSRCPSNRPMGRYTRRGYKLEFRANGVATVTKTSEPNNFVGGAVYLISARDLYNLDICEGYYPGDHVRSKYIRRKFKSRAYGVIYYYQMRTGYALRSPSADYIGRIRTGYGEWQLPTLRLETAVTVAESATILRRPSKSYPVSWYDSKNPFDFVPGPDKEEDQLELEYLNSIGTDEELTHLWASGDFDAANELILRDIETHGVRKGKNSDAICPHCGKHSEATECGKPRRATRNRKAENLRNAALAAGYTAITGDTRPDR